MEIRGKPPQPVRSLNKKNIFILVTVLAVVVGYLTMISLSGASSEIIKIKPKQMAAQPSQKVSELPDNYIRKPTAIPAQNNRVVDPEFEILKEARLKRLKSAQLARESAVSFQQVNLDNKESREISLGQGISLNESGLADDDQNKQGSKKAFLDKERAGKEILPNRVRERLSDYQLSAGTIIPGVLLTGINSDLPGQILGQVSQNVYDSVSGNFLLIPQGAKIVGEYDSRVVYGQERVLIVWTRILFPDGSSINLEGMPGVDMSGYAGLTDKVNNHYMKLLGGVVFSSLLSATAQMADGRNYNSIDPDFSELATQGAAKNINDVGQQITQKNLYIQPTLEIRPGMRFNVFVNRNMVLNKLD